MFNCGCVCVCVCNRNHHLDGGKHPPPPDTQTVKYSASLRHSHAMRNFKNVDKYLIHSCIASKAREPSSTQPSSSRNSWHFPCELYKRKHKLYKHLSSGTQRRNTRESENGANYARAAQFVPGYVRRAQVSQHRCMSAHTHTIL